jgi:hypothetical protein
MNWRFLLQLLVVLTVVFGLAIASQADWLPTAP